MRAALNVGGRRRPEGVAAAVVGLGVQAAAPHEGGERVSVRHQDDGVDELGQRPARLRPRANQLLWDGGTGREIKTCYLGKTVDLQFDLTASLSHG